jgi:hypothetical protein
MIFLVVILAVLFGIPWLASSSPVRQRLVAKSEQYLHGDVELEDLTMGWFSGVQLRGLSITESSTDTGAEPEPAFAVERVAVDWSASRWFGGAWDLLVTVERPEIRVHRRDGRTNWEAILGPPEPEAPGSRDTPREDRPPRRGDRDEPVSGPERKRAPPGKDEDAEPFRMPATVRMRLSEGSLTVVDEDADSVTVVEGLSCDLETTQGSPRIEFTSKGMLASTDSAGLRAAPRHPLEAGGLFDAESGTFQLSVDAAAVALEAFLPLIERAAERSLSQLHGSLDVHLEGAGRLGEEMEFDGLVTVADFLVAGDSDREPYRAESLTLTPHLRFLPAEGAVSLEGLAADLGFLELRGVEPEAAATWIGEPRQGTATGIEVRIDLAGLAALLDTFTATQVGLEGECDLRLAAASDWSRWEAADVPVELALLGGARGLRVRHESLPADLELPRNLDLDTRGTWSASAGRLDLPGAKLELGDSVLAADLSAGRDGSLAARVSLDVVQDLVAALLAAYAGDSVTARGPASLRLDLLRESGAAPEAVAATGLLSTPPLEVLENALPELPWNFQWRENRLGFSLEGPVKLLGGPLAFEGDLTLDPEGKNPFGFSLSWNGGHATGPLAPLLRYVVPPLAGLEGVDLDATVAVAARLRGPTRTEEGAGIPELLAAWSGSGSVGLTDGSFRPAAAFQELAPLLGHGDRVEFSRLSTDFRLDAGSLLVPLVMERDDRELLRMEGTTGLDGVLDYALDLTALFQDRQQVQEILAMTGADRLGARLQGTVDRPVLELDEGLESTLSGAASGLLEKLEEDPAATVNEVLDLFRRGSGKKDRD